MNEADTQMATALNRMRRASESTVNQMATALIGIRQSGIEMGLTMTAALVFEQGRRLGFEQGIAAANEYTKAAEGDEAAAKERREDR